MVLKTFCNHLWYLSDKTRGFTFYVNVSVDLKKKYFYFIAYP
jgi:hypothetical protein